MNESEQGQNGLKNDLPMPLGDYKRYGRQMVLEDWGLQGQLKLRQAKVLVIGVGGLGCPVLQTLAAVGVGRLGLVDFDHVDISNLQRQFLHTEDRSGWSKTRSAKEALHCLNSGIEIVEHESRFTRDVAEEIVSVYDIVVDCTDNPTSRYLINDICIMTHKPLVSGAALRHEGQLTIYNYPTGIGPCYRCLFPEPPRDVPTCQDAGVWIGTTAMVGTCQAIETVKLILGKFEEPYRATMTLFNVFEQPVMRQVMLRGRKKTCTFCSQARPSLPVGEDMLCQVGQRLDKARRISVLELQKLTRDARDFSQVLDVRPRVEFGIAHLPGSFNLPLDRVVKEAHTIPFSAKYVICRRGNDSSQAVQMLESCDRSLKDVVGGLEAWSKEVDRTFPVY